MQFYLFDSTWPMVQEFLQFNTTNLYYERLMIFEDWNQTYTIIENEMDEDDELDPNHFVIPKSERGKPLLYTEYFETQSEISHKKMKRSVHEFSDYMRELTYLPGLNSIKNVGRGIHIKVRDQ